ncbi:hypothetical protein ACFOET_02420 [Parapedobacter deserti]|uniref:Uncharacterized protein n=1 Tax=Parapedobacter deserti TaxID=1912957 RepID=A0ABV7JK60_9SPHI
MRQLHEQVSTVFFTKKFPNRTASRTGQLAVRLLSPCCQAAVNTRLTASPQQAASPATRSSLGAVRQRVHSVRTICPLPTAAASLWFNSRRQVWLSP